MSFFAFWDCFAKGKERRNTLIRIKGTKKITKRRRQERAAGCTEERGRAPSFFMYWYPPGYQYLYIHEKKGVLMVDLFADIPRETVENTLQTIRENLDRVGLYGGHTLRRHADIQPLALKTRLTTEDIRYATSYWDREVADAVVKGIMKSFFDPGITTWLRYGGDDCISLVGHFSRTIGYGFRKGEERLEENLRKARLVLVKDADADWGFRILTSYPMFGRREKFCG